MPIPEEVDTYSCRYSGHYIIGPPVHSFSSFLFDFSIDFVRNYSRTKLSLEF